MTREATREPPPSEPAVPSLAGRAAEDLRLIRRSMDRSSLFTAVPGRGGMLMGVVGLLGSVFASRQQDSGTWLDAWLLTAGVGILVGAWALLRSSRAAAQPLLGPTGRRFGLAMLPALVLGAALTFALAARGLHSALPGTWLLAYGAGVTTGGLLSLPIVAVMGASFMAFGLAALVLPPAAGDACMAAGFGGLHLFFGWLIARRHAPGDEVQP
jgi:hypothetical protein